MKFISNTGRNRVFDGIQNMLGDTEEAHVVTPSLSLFAWEAFRSSMAENASVKLVVPPNLDGAALLGTAADRAARNRLDAPYLASKFANQLKVRVQVRGTQGKIPQGLVVAIDRTGEPTTGWLGALAITTDGLGLTPGNPLSLVQSSETSDEARTLAGWFEQQWNVLGPAGDCNSDLQSALTSIYAPHDPNTVYALILNALLGGEQALDEDRVVNAATGIHGTAVWKKLYKFQRDGVVGAIDKLNRYGGCILADSVGLGKTFQALAVIKYHERKRLAVAS